MMFPIDTDGNPLHRSFFYSFVEVLGEAKARELFLHLPIKPEELEKTHLPLSPAQMIDEVGGLLEEEFGGLAAQGLLIRTGRGALTFFRRFSIDIAVLGSLENRLKPVDHRFFHSLEELACYWSNESTLASRVDQVDRYEYVWKMAPPADWGKAAFVPFFLFGLLEEFCSWLDARKTYQIIFSEPHQDDEIEIFIAIRTQE